MDRLISKFFIIVFFSVFIFKIFSLYSPHSSDKIYLDFVNQVKYLKQLIVYNDVTKNGLINKRDLLINLEQIFRVYSVLEDRVYLISAYNTEIVFHFFSYVQINTVSNNSYIPLKVICDIDSYFDDGIASSGFIQSKDEKYYIGCVLLIKNR